MTGRELIEWIQENHAEDKNFEALNYDREYDTLCENHIEIIGDTVCMRGNPSGGIYV